jgi:hypothetical protein
VSTANDLRHALHSFLGDEQYRKFVQQGLHRGRLRFWQQDAWAKFVAARPEMSVALQELESALHVCHVHGDELCPDTAEVFHGCVDLVQSYCEVRNRLFPRSALDIVSTEGNPDFPDIVTVWYCPTCRTAYSAWHADHA